MFNLAQILWTVYDLEFQSLRIQVFIESIAVTSVVNTCLHIKTQSTLTDDPKQIEFDYTSCYK